MSNVSNAAYGFIIYVIYKYNASNVSNGFAVSLVSNSFNIANVSNFFQR